MARATRDARGQAVRLGLLTVLGAACAVIQEPPGGPPDFSPPAILRIIPDSGVVVDRLNDPVRIEFDEVISETSGGGIANLVRLSPRPRELDVNWKRTAIEVRPADGWRSGVVYHLQLLPGMQDLRNNRLDSGRTVTFAIGTEIPDTRMTGIALDWEAGRPAARAIVEAVLLPDSLVYQGLADSTGAFQLAQLPRGTYLVYAAVDENNNAIRDARERYDSARVALDSALSLELWAIMQDTIGPAVQTATYVDSVTMRLELSRAVHPDALPDMSVEVHLLPDTVAVAVDALWTAARLDSAQAAARALADTTPADTTAQEPAPHEPRPEPARRDTATAPDSTAAQRLLRTRPALLKVVIVRMANPMTRGARYLVTLRATSIAGAVAETHRLFLTPAPRDST